MPRLILFYVSLILYYVMRTTCYVRADQGDLNRSVEEWKPKKIRLVCRTASGSFMCIKLKGFDQVLSNMALQLKLRLLEDLTRSSEFENNRSDDPAPCEVAPPFSGYSTRDDPFHSHNNIFLGWWIRGFGPKLSRIRSNEGLGEHYTTVLRLPPNYNPSTHMSTDSLNFLDRFGYWVYHCSHLKNSSSEAFEPIFFDQSVNMLKYELAKQNNLVEYVHRCDVEPNIAITKAVSLLETAFNDTLALVHDDSMSELPTYPANMSLIMKSALTDSDGHCYLKQFFTPLKADGFSYSDEAELVPWTEVYNEYIEQKAHLKLLPIPIGVIELLRLHAALLFLDEAFLDHVWRQDVILLILEALGIELGQATDSTKRSKRPSHAKCPMRSGFFIIETRITAALSFFSLSLMFLLYINAPNLHNPANRLFILDAVSLMLLSAMHFVSRWGPDSGDSSLLCQLQAFVVHWMEMTDALLMASLGINILLIVIWQKQVSALHKLQKVYGFAAFGLALLLTLPLYFYVDSNGHNAFGDACLWCWIRRGRSDLRLSLFVPVWLVFAFLAVSFTFAAMHIRSLEAEFENLSTVPAVSLHASSFQTRAVFVQMAVRYCCAFFLRWIFPTINRIREYMVMGIGPDDWAQLLQALITPSGGFVMFMLFLSNNWEHLKLLHVLPSIKLPLDSNEPARSSDTLAPKRVSVSSSSSLVRAHTDEAGADENDTRKVSLLEMLDLV